jgi:hypothetical protein
LWASALIFLFVEGYALHDQVAIGHASVRFILGTAFLSVGLCIGLFALIAVVGLLASAFFSEQSPGQSQDPLGSIRPVYYSGNPRIYPRVKPDAIRRPASVSKRKRHFRRLGS